MARLRNTATGVVVSVRDDKQLDGYEPVDDKSQSTTTAKSSTESKKSK